jgi:glycosyltransferase involved in cell wall biosynthesis
MTDLLLADKPTTYGSGSADISTASAEERILFVPEIVAFGGGERVYLALSRYLHGRGIPHRIVSYFQDIDLQQYADWPLSLEQLTPPRNPLAKARALGDYLRHRKTQFPGAPAPLLVGLQAAMHRANGRGGNTPYSVMIFDTPRLMGQSGKLSVRRTLPGSLRNAISERYTRIGLHRARTVFIPTEVMANEIEGLYGLRPDVVRLGIAPPTFPVRAAAPAPSPFRFLSVCRLEASKRLDWILHALTTVAYSPELMSSGNPLDWQLDVVGTGSQAGDLPCLASKLGIGDRVVFHGLVSDARLEELYGSAHLFLMPAVQGYGLPALEALVRHVPVVMHRDSGVSEILEDSPWVELISGTNENDLARAITAMVSALLRGTPEIARLPHFPSESDWAEDVCKRCGWF